MKAHEVFQGGKAFAGEVQLRVTHVGMIPRGRSRRMGDEDGSLG
jgi:hypothetical protein